MEAIIDVNPRNHGAAFKQELKQEANRQGVAGTHFWRLANLTETAADRRAAHYVVEHDLTARKSFQGFPYN